MNSEQFTALANQGYNLLPLMREVLVDTDTALSLFQKLANRPYTYLLESVQGGENWGRYSIVGLPASMVLKIFGHWVRLEQAGSVVEQHRVDDPLAFVQEFMGRYKVPDLPDRPRFCGGLVGYFGYDCVRYVEKKLAHAPHADPLGTPDIFLMLSDELAVLDNLSGTLYLVTHINPSIPDAWAKGQQRLDALLNLIDVPYTTEIRLAKPMVAETQNPTGMTTAEDFRNSVETIRQYIFAGDVMQVVLSQRMVAPLHCSAFAVYRALRHLNPSPYLYFMHCGAFEIVGSSPEILVRVADGQVTVRPLAGTRPRGHTREEDLRLEQELLADPKEIAEHLMLIDLGRNDVGRISATGTVRVTETMAVERYSHVMHIVSNVEAQLQDGMQLMDVLRATLPAGTLSGAPKVRAMEIIDELEPVKRGVYGGALGYLGFQGGMDLAIAIRTAVVKDQQIHVQAGAGIVADSVAELEWQETQNKARALFKAVDLAMASVSPHREKH